MNAHQKRCSEAIVRELSRHDLTLNFTEQPDSPPPEDGAVLFLRGDLAHGGRHFKIYVYSDGAGANVGHNWYVLESKDYASSEELTRTFCRFLRRCIEGRHPVDALEEARVDRNSGAG